MDRQISEYVDTEGWGDIEKMMVGRLTYRCVNGWMGRQMDGQIDG